MHVKEAVAIINSKKFEHVFQEILRSFPEKARGGMLRNLGKHQFEITNIVSRISDWSVPKIKVIDFGCGVGINLILLKMLFNFECIALDRYVEFSDHFEREVGTKQTVIDRLKAFGVQVFEVDPVAGTLPDVCENADLVTSFDVIEHFCFSPARYLERMRYCLKSNGAIVVGTPNQVHLKNRLKCLFGKNIWEDFQYWSTCENFFGHVRELTPDELLYLMSQFSRDVRLNYSTYPLADVKGGFIKQIFVLVAKLILKLVPKFNYYMVASGVK
jgi:SAM-dependent methyltransferase